MNSEGSSLDATFLEKQRRYLSRLRAVLRAAVQAYEDDEGEINRESHELVAPRWVFGSR